MRRLRLVLGMLIALAMPAAALAADNAPANVTLAKGDNRTGTYFAAGRNVTIDGNVDGDVMCAGQNVVINGSVGGDVLCAGQSLTINGPVAGSVRSAGQMVTVNGTVGRNVTAAAQDLTIGQGAKIAGEVQLAGQTVVLNGQVDHAAYVAADDLNLAAVLGANFTGYLNTLEMAPAAHVTGNFDYTSQDQLNVDRGKVGGLIAHHLPAPTVRQEASAQARLGMLIYWVAVGLLSMLLLGWLAPRLARGVTDTMLTRWQASLGWGLLALVAGPLVLVIIGLTVVGLPIAGMLFVLWILGLMSSGVFAGIAIGRQVWQRGEATRRSLILSGLVGVPLVVIASWLPLVGGLVGLVTAIWALGGLLVSAQRLRTL